MHATLPRLQQREFPAIYRGSLQTLQVNLGYLCNQSCLHCHVNAGPRRTEQMSRETVDQVLEWLGQGNIGHLDLTGGAPELNPHFRYLVSQAVAMGVRVTDRCNLTVLEVDGQDDLAGFLASERVDIVASLPCYLEQNVNGQRGDGVYAASIRGLQQLNALGYGQPESGLRIDLVYNPTGPTLPPAQDLLQQDYKRELYKRARIVFNDLYTLCNMPIKRFGSTLISRGQFDSYMQLLIDAYQGENLQSVMCRTLVSIDWQGYVYDCDFNQMLNLPLRHGSGRRPHIRDLIGSSLDGLPIAIADHCYGCTAGQGSSCGGALSV